MPRHARKLRKAVLFCLFLFAAPLDWAGGELDKSKYISIDEIKPSMEAYCLTTFKGTKVEKFGLEILSVVRNLSPGRSRAPGSRDVILVRGTDDRFIHTGPVAGCSGSPVYIDGRLAGALAFSWTFSKDPLYGVTPIEEMLEVGRPAPSGHTREWTTAAIDFSTPIDFAEVEKQLTTQQAAKNNSLVGVTALPCPLVISGLPASVCGQLDTQLAPFGLMPVAGGGLAAGTDGAKNARLVPGATLAVPLVTGDIAMEVIGTVTEVSGDTIYGFGHGFLGYGPVELPMATGRIHTVISNLVSSFKLGTSDKIVGALKVDESTAVVGKVGAKAPMIPLTIKVDRYNDTEQKVYNCQIADNRVLTPLILRSVVAGAALMRGQLPPDNTVDYKAQIDVQGAEPITFENVSTALGVDEMIREGVGAVALLMNNPYRRVKVTSLSFDVRILPKNIVSRIWSVDLSDSKVKPGGHIEVSVVVQTALSAKRQYRCQLQIPQNLQPGNYQLIVSGAYGYLEFLRKAVPYRFVPENLPSLVDALNNILQIKRDRLYCLLVLPPGGVTIEKAELPDLPPTKALILQSPKRALKMQPYSHWLQKSLQTDTVIFDKKVMRITVKR